MTYRINALSSRQEAEVMVAADSFDGIIERTLGFEPAEGSW